MDNHLLAKIGQYAIMLNSKGAILILKRKRSKSWSLPGGRLEKDEREPMMSFSREINEETKINCSNLIPIKVSIIEDPYQVKYCVYFICHLDADINPVIDKNEHSDYKWIKLEEVDSFNLEYPEIKQIIRSIKRV